jgi:hypothetical protein
VTLIQILLGRPAIARGEKLDFARLKGVVSQDMQPFVSENNLKNRIFRIVSRN